MSRAFLRFLGGVATAVALLMVSGIADAKFCWRQSYGRGVGTIPTNCGSGTNDAGLCYTPCKAGYGGAGPVCWGNCPSGMSDHGVGCTKPGPYGRGAGYPWHWGDALNDNGMLSRCRKDNSQGCEKWGAVAYPKCKAGFHPVGCCICSPDCPSGYADSGATCIKPTYGRGVGTIPTSCTGGRQYDVGLCYDGCKAKFNGVGPVCWQQCPPSMGTNCGAGCADSQDACSNQIRDQVMSVVEVAITVATTVATFGAGTAAKTAASAAGKAAVKEAVKKSAVKITKAQAVNVLKAAGTNLSLQQIDQAAGAAAGDDWDPSSLDPTGIMAVINAYKSDICPDS